MKHLILYSLLFLSVAIFAQEKDRNLPKANEAFDAKKYDEAEANYRISESNNPTKATASYNLGNAIYKQNQIGEAKFSYQKALKNATLRPEKHQAFYNLGNVFMKEKNYAAAVEAYKNALRNNPEDEQSRYNYVLAKKMLKENPPKKNDKKDKKEDKKDEKKKEDQKDKKDDKNKDKDNKEDKKDGEGNNKKDKPQPKPSQGGISKQRLENLLDAVNNEEKKIQDKVNAKKVKGKPVQTEKDW